MTPLAAPAHIATLQAMDLREITIHDQRITYCSAGSGPVLLLIHGMAGSATTWRPRTHS